MKDLDGPKLKYMHFFQDNQLLALRKKVYLYKKSFWKQVKQEVF